LLKKREAPQSTWNPFRSGTGVLEIVSQSSDPGELVAGLGIEVSVAAAEIDGTMTDPEVGQPTGIVVADRDVTGCVDHPIAGALITFERQLRKNVAERGQVLGSSKPNRIEQDRALRRRGSVVRARRFTLADLQARDRDSAPDKACAANLPFP
jgi:hypothetical protein